MTNTNKIFKNLGKFMSYEEKTVKADLPNKIVIKYTQPQYQDPTKVWELGIFEDRIKDELLERIVGLSSGEEMCVHTQKNNNGFLDLIDITDAKDVPAPAKRGNPTYKKPYTPYTAKDDSGIAVGAAWTNALDVLKVSDYTTRPISPEDTITRVAGLVKTILKLKLDQEAELRAAKVAKVETKTTTSPTTKTAKEAKPKPSKIELLRAKAEAKKAAETTEEDLEIEGDLDEINFD